jgi:hypothetical protein
MVATLKAIFIAIIAAGMVIASFYVAYLFLVILVLGVVGFPAYLYFNLSKKLRKPYYHV